MKESYKSLGEWIKEMVNEEKIALENSDANTAAAAAHKKHSKEKPQLNQENHGHSMKMAAQKNVHEEEDDKMEEETSPKTDENLPISNESPVEGSLPELTKVMEEEKPEKEEASAEEEQPVLTKKKSNNQKEKEKEKAKNNKGKQPGKAKASVKSSPEGVLEEVDEKKNRNLATEEEEEVRGSPQKKKGNSKVLDEINMKRKQSYHNQMKEAASSAHKNGVDTSLNKSPQKKGLVQEKPKNNSGLVSVSKEKNQSSVPDLKGSKIKRHNERAKENKKEENGGSSESDDEGYQIKKKTKGSGENGTEKKHNEESKELTHQMSLSKGSKSFENAAVENFFMKDISE